MKARIATAISVAGVLIAGTAAAAVNTTILDGGTPSGAASQAVLPPAATVDVTIPTTAAPSSESSSTSTSLPTTSLPNNTTPTSSTVPGGSTSGGSSLTGMLTAFTVGSAGVVTVDVVSGHVVFVSATPNAGWIVTETEQDDSDDDDGEMTTSEVEVTFASSTTIVEFEVDLVNGQLVPHVESSQRRHQPP